MVVTPVIPELREAAAEGWKVQAQLGQFSDFVRPCLKIKKFKKGCGGNLV